MQTTTLPENVQYTVSAGSVNAERRHKPRWDTGLSSREVADWTDEVRMRAMEEEARIAAELGHELGKQNACVLQHMDDVAEEACLLASMLGMTCERIDRIVHAALLHDIEKFAVLLPGEKIPLYLKSGLFTADERSLKDVHQEHIESRCLEAAQIFRRGCDIQHMIRVAMIVGNHHIDEEHGRGPHKLGEQELREDAILLMVADLRVSIMENRGDWHPGKPFEVTLEKIRRALSSPNFDRDREFTNRLLRVLESRQLELELYSS